MRVEIVLPFVAGGVALADLVLWIGILVGGVLALAYSRWIFVRAASLAGNLPFGMGGAVQSRIYALRDGVYNLSIEFAAAFGNAIFNISRDYVQLQRAVMAGPLQLLGNTANIANEARAIAWYWRDTWRPIWEDYINNTANIANEARAIAWYWRDTWRPIWEDFINNTANIANEARAYVYEFRDHVLPAHAAAIAELENRTRALELFRDTYWPLLRELQTYPRSIPRDLADVRDRTGTLEHDRVKDRADINELLPAAVIAAAGAAVISELVRIGRNPCGVCPQIDLSDIEGRLAAVEVETG